jgi:hypothetical protein
MRHHRFARMLAVLALMAATASCATGTDHPASASGEPSASVSTQPFSESSAPTGSSVSGSPSSGRSTSAPAGTPAATPGGATRLCLSGTVTVLYPASDNPLRSTCVHVGTRIQITLKPPANYSWAPVTSSAPKAVTVLDSQVAPDGTRSAAARAAAGGTATLESADTYTPDPHGPPSKPWQLTLTVVP